MATGNRTITSREYKLMLNPLCFRDRAAGAAEFWSLVALLGSGAGAEIDEAQDEETVRTTWYLDTPENASQLELAGASRLETVSGLRAHEIMRKVGKLRFDGGPSVKVCLNFWYPSPEIANTPLAAEFSFDYDLPESDADASNALEQFPLATVLGARRLFQAAQRQGAWIDLTGSTKTDLAYGDE